jgi:hypothetical protein
VEFKNALTTELAAAEHVMNVQTRVIAARVMGVQAAGAIYGKGDITDVQAATTALANELVNAEAALAQSRVDVCRAGLASVATVYQASAFPHQQAHLLSFTQTLPEASSSQLAPLCAR